MIQVWTWGDSGTPFAGVLLYPLVSPLFQHFFLYTTGHLRPDGRGLQW